MRLRDVPALLTAPLLPVLLDEQDLSIFVGIDVLITAINRLPLLKKLLSRCFYLPRYDADSFDLNRRDYLVYDDVLHL